MAYKLDKLVPPEEPKELKDIVNQLSNTKRPPPPIKMRVLEYIDFLNFLKSKPEKQGKVLAALNEYNKACTNAANVLTNELREIYRK